MMQPLLINVGIIMMCFRATSLLLSCGRRKKEEESQQRGHIQGEKKQIIWTIEETFKEILENI